MTSTEVRPRWREILAILTLRDVQFWLKSWPRRFCRVLAFGAYAYVGVLIVLLALENRLLFPGATFGQEWVQPAPEIGMHDVELTSADGNTIHAWWTPPKGWKPSDGAILYSHGNGGNLSIRQWTIVQWRDVTNNAVLIYDYPGYGKSSGKPTEAGCYAAVDAAYAWLIDQQKVPPSQLILVGSSLGGAMAADLASRREHRALVLVNAFTSFPDMAQKAFPFLPARWLVHNRLDNLGKIKQCRSPIFITHGTADPVIPFAQGERLFAAAPDPKRFLKRDGDGHGHPANNAFFSEVLAFLLETTPK
jgi:fermentation-respiration switch protein FrsA (DUF1100 family)